MRLKQCIENLVPAANYEETPWIYGEFHDYTKTDYDNLIWNDTRNKPLWDDIIIEWVKLLKQDLYEKIEVIRDTKIESGVTYLFPDGIYGTIQTRDSKDQRNIQINNSTAQLFIMLGQTDQIMEFRDMENVIHELIPQEMIDMTLYVGTYGQAMYKNSWNHKDYIRGLPNTAETLSILENYDLTQNWDF